MTKERKVNQHPSEYLNDLEEWQNHQYDPGYYLGGNISPQLKYGSGNLFGLFFFVLFIISGLRLIISKRNNN